MPIVMPGSRSPAEQPANGAVPPIIAEAAGIIRDFTAPAVSMNSAAFVAPTDGLGPTITLKAWNTYLLFLNVYIEGTAITNDLGRMSFTRNGVAAAAADSVAFKLNSAGAQGGGAYVSRIMPITVGVDDLTLSAHYRIDNGGTFSFQNRLLLAMPVR